MQGCRNAIEDLVVEEAKSQIAKMGTGTREQVDLNAVVAYALNRLPPMYATTHRGWVQQRKRAESELKERIAVTVRRALLGVKKDTLKEQKPLPESELESQARSLARLQEILGRPQLTWKEVPNVVEEVLLNVKLKSAVSYTYLSTTRRDALGGTDYIKREKPQYSWKGRQTGVSNSARAFEGSDAKEFATYMSVAHWGFKNVLENLVIHIVEQQVQRLHPTVAQQVNREEVAAYALNRLPPMYATSDRGFKQQRVRAKQELAGDIVAIVRQAVVNILNSPARILPPLPFDKFRIEQEHALEELSEMFQVVDLDWRNVPELVEDAIERVRTGEIVWKRRSTRPNAQST